MELRRSSKEENNYTWYGLTLGKLLAIRNAFEDLKLQNAIGPVGNDVLIFLKNQDLDSDWEDERHR